MQILSPQTLEEEWRKNKLRPVYYFCGAEHTLQDEALSRMRAVFKPDDFNFSSHCAEGADMGAITGLAHSPPMLRERRFIVLKRCEKLKKDAVAELAAYLSDPAPFTSLFLVSSKRGEAADPVAKALCPDSAQVFFEPLNGAQASGFLKRRFKEKNCTVSDEAVETLIDLLGTDTGALSVEAEKIAAYQYGSKSSFGAMEALELAGFSRGQNPFDLTNAICERASAKAAGTVDKQLEEGVEPLALLYSVSRTLERLLKVKHLEACGAGPSAPFQAGLSPQNYRRLAGYAGSYSEDKLLRGLKRCLETEALMKSSSGRSPKLLVRQLVYEILKFK